MLDSRVLKFRELIEKLVQNNCSSSICSLLNIQIPHNEYEELAYGRVPELLMYRLSDTWWEVSWPVDVKDKALNEKASYKYIADNIEDLIRLRPDVDLPFWDMAYEYANNIIDDEDYDDVDFYSAQNRFDTVTDSWEYLNYDFCG